MTKYTFVKLHVYPQTVLLVNHEVSEDCQKRDISFLHSDICKGNNTYRGITLLLITASDFITRVA